MRATRYQDPIADVIEIIPNSDSGAIASLISEIRAYDSRGMVVLSRIHALLDKLSVELTALNIPHVKIGRKTALVESEEFRRFHAFLKLLVNPFDNFSFLLIRDLIGVSREEYNKIRLQATQESKSHFQVWRSIDHDSIFCAFFDSIEQWCFNEVISALAGTEFPWTFDVKPINDFIFDWSGKNGGGVTDYLDWLATWDIQEELTEEKETDKVQLMTVHASKGLEFPVVIVAGCNEGILPSQQAINSGEIEEERRLMYVAMTRAMDNLILTVRPEKKEDAFGRVQENPVSRFIKELEVPSGRSK
jgi:DNA helicase-2/ATP-dependent DNA helicase PcrA